MPLSSAASYRWPGLLAKTVTTLDVLSRGRAWLGIGAGDYEAEARGLNVTAGLVLSDRILRKDLLCTPERALAESRDLIERWHGKGRLRYAVTPRFSRTRSSYGLLATSVSDGISSWTFIGCLL